MYALNKQRGLIQPRVESSGKMQPAGTNLVGTYTIKNPEDEPLRFTSRQLEYQFCDPQRHSTPLAPTGQVVAVGAKQQVTQQIDLPRNSIAADVCGLAIYLAGETASHVTAGASVYFDLKQNPLTARPERDQATLRLLNGIVAQRLVGNADVVTDEDLYRLTKQGKIAAPSRPTLAASAPSLAAPLTPLAGPAPDAPGERCTPGDTPPRAGVSCQVVPGEWERSAPRIANALKGDIILSATCGIIGNLLRHVSPPQMYSHTGIMTKDYYEVRHSTAAPARCGDDLDLTYPRVVKPVPGSPPEVRARLHAAADAAQGISGHYRFFGYTDGAITGGRRYDAPAGSSWSEGTLAAVCSSFIREALKKVGVELEGPTLEPADRARGAERDGATADGLYLYTEAERRAGARQLYAAIHNTACSRSGWLGRALTDAPDDLANQLVNCFGCDWCDDAAKDSRRWEHPVVGRAVSPHNVVFWDAPPRGVYGYSEALVYRSGEYWRLHRWQATTGTGVVTGRVLSGGAPVASASATLMGLERSTDSSGAFRFEAIPAGRYAVEASKLVDGLLLSGSAEVTAVAGPTRSVDLHLQLPPNSRRLVTIEGDMHIVDDESWPESDEKKDVPVLKTFRLDPRAPTQSDTSIRPCVGGEARVELDLDLRLADDNRAVVLSGEARLFEGTSCDTTDREDTVPFSLTVPEDSERAHNIYLYNHDEGGDHANINLVVRNARQP